MVLLEDVPGMGSIGDIVLSPRSYARNYLIPFKKAYYVPRELGKPILPDNWTLPVSTSAVQLETITPAIVKVPYSEEAESVDSMPVQELRERLSLVSLVFTRVLINQDSDKIFGSITPFDIHTQLFENFGLNIDRDTIQCKLKTIGKHTINISVGQELVKVPVEIKSQ